MVNSIAPFGIQDLRRREGGSPTLGLEQVRISSTDPTAIFNGDVVQDLGATVASGNFGSYITQASSGLQAASPGFRGIFRGCEFLNTAVGRVVWSPFWPGGTAAGVSSQADPIAYISQDDEMMFIAQGTSAATLGASNIGMNIGVTLTASLGNTVSGQSVIALQSTGVGTSSSHPFRILDFYSNYAPPGGFVNGTDNSTAGQILVVQPNNWMNKQNTGV